ncbi:hypothetical protein L7F22_000573 [Adiantum nelumboides]|nr:hypothetical protein [Adiantum nelumboides]
MSRLDTGNSSSTSRPSSRAHGFDRRNSLASDNANTREAGGSGNNKVTVDVKDDDDDVQIISPRSVAQARMAKRNRRRTAATSSTRMDLELTLGSPAVVPRKASTKVSRNAIIDLTEGNDDEVVPLALGWYQSQVSILRPVGYGPLVRLEDHTIDLIPGSTPPNRPPYRVSRAQNEEIMNQVKDLLEKGLIQPSSSPFCSPVLLVLKNDGSWRMCIDYRALNKITIRNRLPIPRIDDIRDRLQGSLSFTRIDMKSGYHQIRIALGDVYKTVFRTTFGLFEFLVMPFGLTNAPATFNRMMDRIFREYRLFVGTFFDDIIVFSKNEAEHRVHLLQKRKSPQISPELSKDVQLTCAICMDAMKEETSTVCGHIFCRPCILGAIKTQKKCPTCRRKLTNSNIHRIYLSSGTR